ncbi:MAG: acyl-CoA desaturase [Symploca sp. SIO3C6]|nr:acyl-CoA desaturase [Symploca sp. SIO3C6]
MIMKNYSTRESFIGKNMNLSVYPKYSDLKGFVEQAGCFDSQIDFYTYRLIMLVGFLVLNILVLLFCDIFLLQIFNSICLAFVFVQISLLAHDIVHRQAWKNIVIDIIIANLFLGISCSWWHNKHNKKHHRHTNQLGLDADIEAPFLAFSKEQVSEKKGFEKFIIRYQAYYVFLLFIPIPLYMTLESINFLMSHKVKYKLLEIISIIIHFSAFFLFLFISHMSISQILIFFAISKGLFGLYLGSIFIVNHTGMPVLCKSDKVDYFLSQIITARNVKSHLLIDFIMGGLNAQIEHHLFPQIARYNLKQARNIVRDFCENYNIPYHETGLWQAFKETLTYLNTISSLSVSK